MSAIPWKQDVAADAAEESESEKRVASSAWLMVLPAAASLIFYVALLALMTAPSFRLTRTLTVFGAKPLRDFVALVTPDSMAAISWESPQAVTLELVYLLLVVGLVGAWLVALRIARSVWDRLALPWVLLAASAFSAPLVWLPGMFSGDIYLYMFYGRMIAKYGDNPFLMRPIQYPGDPHLSWVFWQNLPSSYGPAWLLLSGLLSRLAGDELFPNLFWYKFAALLLHLGTTAAVWAILRRVKPELALWGAVFYGWNPMVLFESVGSGHNDVMMAFFASLSLLAAVRRHWLIAVALLTGAALVKISGGVLIPVLVAVYVLQQRGMRDRMLALLKAGAVGAATGLAAHAPLWAGAAPLTNVRENPAARDYLNSVWDLLSLRLHKAVPSWSVTSIQDRLDIVRAAVLLVGLLLVGVMFWRRRSSPGAMFWVWFVYCLSLSWIWPWYFVLLIPFAAVRGPSRVARVAVGCTVGGLIFWLGWPDPPLPHAPALYTYRALLLMLPPLIALAPDVWRFVSRATTKPEIAA